MNLIYYKSKIGNFGDDLNKELWEKVLGPYSKKNDHIDLIGIGSILDERIEQSPNKRIILGSGVRSFLYNPNNIDILNEYSFVRGPISSKVIGIPYITDSAYAIALLEEDYKRFLSTPKKFRLSYIPYYEQCDSFNWDIFEKITSMHVIKPTDNVDKVLLEIAQSERIITSAMHGAIMADIFRIPWMRLKFGKQGNEHSLTSELKWQDWLLSIEINNPLEIYSDLNLNAKNNTLNSFLKTLFLKRKLKYLRYNLSSQQVFDDRIQQLRYKMELIKNSFL